MEALVLHPLLISYLSTRQAQATYSTTRFTDVSERGNMSDRNGRSAAHTKSPHVRPSLKPQQSRLINRSQVRCHHVFTFEGVPRWSRPFGHEEIQTFLRHKKKHVAQGFHRHLSF